MKPNGIVYSQCNNRNHENRGQPRWTMPCVGGYFNETCLAAASVITLQNYTVHTVYDHQWVVVLTRAPHWLFQFKKNFIYTFFTKPFTKNNKYFFSSLFIYKINL